MNIDVHYGDRTYRLSEASEEARRRLLLDLRDCASGGIVDINTPAGRVSLVVGPGIPVAVVGG